MRDLTKHRASVALVRAIRRSPQSATQLAAPIGLTATRISELVHFKPFGAVRRLKVLGLAIALGIDPDRSTVRLRRPR